MSLKTLSILQQKHCESISYTIPNNNIFEFAYDCAKIAHEKGIKNVFVSNGIQQRGCQTHRTLLDAIT